MESPHMRMRWSEGRPFQSEHEGGVQGFVPQRLTASVPAYQVSWLTTMSPSTLRSAPLSSRKVEYPIQSLRTQKLQPPPPVLAIEAPARAETSQQPWPTAAAKVVRIARVVMTST